MDGTPAARQPLVKVFSMSKSHHIVPHKDGWAIKRSGSERASHVCGTQKEAIDKGRAISRNQGTEFFIHDSKGRIRERDSHGNDDFPPRG